MPDPNPEKILPFSTCNKLNEWFKTHHAVESELWVKIFKKHSGVSSVTWNEVVLEALCWGWIDGVKKSFDEESYLQRITPRSKKSNWSKLNTKHVARLIKEGRMQPSGLVQVDAAKADGRWEKAYALSEMQVPQDFILALDNEPAAKQFFETLPQSSRAMIAIGLTGAKKLETRQRRFDKFMDMLVKGVKPN
ncbi:MAG: YdeI/OmpD-associated family protein [Gammaproteobacteria bacterium]|nr:YdeI/OmpD-associated family protein [Gammaproteobacteria bacterium]